MNALRIGTDCSGIEAPIEALKQLGIPFKHKWSCEIDKFARQSILANYEPEMLFEDITKRDHSALPDTELYVCGFPCQSFSLMGNKKGTGDPRSNIMNHCIEVIKKKRPPVFILENVKNFQHIEKGKPFNFLISELYNITDDDNESIYNIYHDIYNTKDYGIPQNRERIYIVGINKGIQISEYEKPDGTPMKPLEEFIIDKSIKELDTKSKMLIKNLEHFNNITSANIVTPFTYYYPIKNCSPTLTTYCKHFFVTKYNRTLNTEEALLLQGFEKSFKIAVSDSQLSKQIGNSMSVNVLKAIIKQILQCSLLGEIFR